MLEVWGLFSHVGIQASLMLVRVYRVFCGNCIYFPIHTSQAALFVNLLGTCQSPTAFKV